MALKPSDQPLGENEKDEGRSSIASASEMDLSDAKISNHFDTPQTLEEYRAAFNQIKSQLIEIQGETEQVTDSTVKKHYEHLCDAVERWIDGVNKDERRHFFQDQFQDIMKKSPHELSRLGLDQADSTPDGKPILGDKAWFLESMRWLGSLDTCDSVVQSLAIWCFLKDKVFDEKGQKYPIGTTGYNIVLFEEIHGILEKKHQRKGI